MIFVDVPKDINEYHEKIIAGMSFRQVKWGSIAILTALGWSFLTVSLLHMPMDVGIYGSVGLGFILFACGWGDYQGLPISEYIIVSLRYYMTQQTVEYDNGLFKQDGKGIKHVKKKKRKERKADRRLDQKINESEG